MDRVSVRSSNLRAVGYDEATATLEVQFHSGSVYAYRGVPPDVHAGLMGASSKGSYFDWRIKDRYPTVRVR